MLVCSCTKALSDGRGIFLQDASKMAAYAHVRAYPRLCAAHRACALDYGFILAALSTPQGEQTQRDQKP